jgi:hypothetical protein
MTFKEFYQYTKKLVIADSKLYMEPYVAVYKFIKRDFTRSSVKR